MMHEWWATIDTLNGIPHFSTLPREKILHMCEGLELVKLGEELRERLHGIGFHGTTSLTVPGMKP